MLKTIGTFILNYLKGVVTNDLIPWLMDWAKKLFRKKEIDKEEDVLKEEMQNLKQQAQDWLRDNPDKPLPKELEDKLRAAARRINRL